MLAAAQGIPGIRDLMQFTPLTVAQWGQCCLLSLAGTLWVEGYNAWQRRPKGLGR